MATYLELRNLFNSSDELLCKIEVAVIIAANALPSTAANNSWIAQAYTSPRAEAEKALMGVLATNKSIAVGAILSATDAQIQTAVNAIVPTLVAARAGV